jgi:NADH dehydrogenase
LAPGLKTIEDALEIRRRVLNAFEQAENEVDPLIRQEWLTFVVIGGGPTGAELAGALSEIARQTLLRDFRNFEPQDARVVLLEGGSRILATYPEELSMAALTQLRKLGVDVWTDSLVTEITEREVSIKDQSLPTRTVLWAAGVTASPLGQYLGENRDRSGRVQVSPDLSVVGHPEIFVAGDLAALSQDGNEIPGVAPAAIQEGRSAAGNILRILEGKTSLPFRYVDRGSMATLGRSSAVAEIRRLHLTGFPAWLAWLTIHIYFLIGFRNRLVVLIEWARSYFTYQRSARLILNEPQAESPKPNPRHPSGDAL